MIGTPGTYIKLSTSMEPVDIRSRRAEVPQHQQQLKPDFSIRADILKNILLFDALESERRFLLNLIVPAKVPKFKAAEGSQ